MYNVHKKSEQILSAQINYHKRTRQYNWCSDQDTEYCWHPEPEAPQGSAPGTTCTPSPTRGD